MTQTTRQADAVIQELWRIKDAAFESAGRDPKRFVQQLREASAELRETHGKTVNSQANHSYPKSQQR